MAAVTQETIINSALELVGHTALASFDTDEVGAASLRRYLSLKRKMLADHPWRFAIKDQALSQLTGTGSGYLADWQYAYTMPSDCLQPLGLVSDSYMVPFEVTRGELYTDMSENVTLRYISECSETYFAAYFVEALTLSLAAQFAREIADNSTRAQELLVEADRATKRARLCDSQIGPAKSMISALKRTINTRPTARY